jgi:hypothetical protein
MMWKGWRGKHAAEMKPSKWMAEMKQTSRDALVQLTSQIRRTHIPVASSSWRFSQLLSSLTPNQWPDHREDDLATGFRPPPRCSMTSTLSCPGHCLHALASDGDDDFATRF